MEREVTHKLYIDDSGDKNYLKDPSRYRKDASRYFALGGILVPVNTVPDISHEIMRLKLAYFNDESVEIKSNWLRNSRQWQF